MTRNTRINSLPANPPLTPPRRGAERPARGGSSPPWRGQGWVGSPVAVFVYAAAIESAPPKEVGTPAQASSAPRRQIEFQKELPRYAICPNERRAKRRVQPWPRPATES